MSVAGPSRHVPVAGIRIPWQPLPTAEVQQKHRGSPVPSESSSTLTKESSARLKIKCVKQGVEDRYVTEVIRPTEKTKEATLPRPTRILKLALPDYTLPPAPWPRKNVKKAEQKKAVTLVSSPELRLFSELERDTPERKSNKFIHLFVLIKLTIDPGVTFLNDVVDEIQAEVKQHGIQLDNLMPGILNFQDRLTYWEMRLEKRIQLSKEIMDFLTECLDETNNQL